MTDSPDVGWTIATTAGDAGLVPDACGVEALASPGGVAFGVEPEHAAHADQNGDDDGEAGHPDGHGVPHCVTGMSRLVVSWSPFGAGPEIDRL